MDEKKVREAIEVIKGYRRLDEYMNNTKRLPYCDMAIEALEKQLPKRVEVEEWNPARCPSCGIELSEALGDGYYRHPTFLKRCPNEDCGQLLDWGNN